MYHCDAVDYVKINPYALTASAVLQFRREDPDDGETYDDDIYDGASPDEMLSLISMI